MIISTESYGIRNNKSLQVCCSMNARTVYYIVTWHLPEEYDSKTFPEGSFADAVDFYHSIDVKIKEIENTEIMIDEIVKDLMSDAEAKHYYEMYEVIPCTPVHDGLWVSLEDVPDGDALQFEYPDNTTEWMEFDKPDAEVFRRCIEKAKKKAENIIDCI